MFIMKVELKELYKLGWDWDTPLDGGLRDMWLGYMEMLVKTCGIKFNRATRPENAVGRSILVCFFDGSDLAFGVEIFVRWVLDDGSVWVYLVAAKF
jgi:hypothetical protein